MIVRLTYLCTIHDLSLASFPPSLRQITTSIPVGNYSQFLAATLAAISKHLVSSVFNNFVLNWYECQLQLVNQWLEKRPSFSLHAEQLSAIATLKEVGGSGREGWTGT